MERDEPSSSETVTVTRPRNGKAKPIRLNNKTKADAYNKVKKRESEMSYSSITDVKGRRVQTTHAVEDKSNKNEQDVAHSRSQQNSQSKVANSGGDESLLVDVHVEVKSMKNLAWVERSNKTSGPFYNDVYGKDYDDSINNSGRSSVKTGTNSAVAGVSDQNIGISILLMDTGDKEIQDIEMKLQGKEFHVQIDEYKKLFSAMLLIDNDEKTHQHFGKKEKMELKKLIKKVKQLQSQLLKENQLIELENTELVVPLLKEQHVLKERESDLQKEDELKEQVKTELAADNILFHRTKVRNAKSKMNTSSLYRAFNLCRKDVLERELLLVEQLMEALDSLRSPHYIWPSGHPLLLSKERQIELYFSSNEHMERLHSFVNGTNRWHRTWNSDQIVRPEPMVLAGFSYDGEDDKVVCKSCGAISDVNDWSDDDEDYAFTMHRRTGSSHCEFLRKFDPWRSKM